MRETILNYCEAGYSLHSYVIMPDHLHLLIVPTETLEKAVQLIKGGFSFRAKRDFAWKSDIWQPGFSDHRIRDEEDWIRHLEYIHRNPIRSRLTDPYPYIGFPDAGFPQGLKPPAAKDTSDVRAEARTLQGTSGARAKSRPVLDTSEIRAEARTLIDSERAHI
jgi:hypothetical protein